MNLKRFIRSFWDRDFEDIEKLVKAFPSALKSDVRTVAAILPFDERAFTLADETIRRHDFLVTEYRPDELSLGNETVRLPYRVYLAEPKDDQVARLTVTQQTVLDCIYLRHNDGFVRQRRLERLVGNTDSFICPFTIRLLGEYVIEILQVLESIITGETIDVYTDFLCANEFFWQQTQSRVVSYWNEYYRSDFPKLNGYVGKQIVDRLNVAVRTRNTNKKDVLANQSF